MGTRHLLLLVLLVLVPLLASGQDWQDCKPDGDFSFKEIKATVRRVTTSRMYTSWDEKTFNRSGDLVAVAVLQTLEDGEMASQDGAKNVLSILREAFACPQRCVKSIDDRRPRVTLLVLEHLRKITPQNTQADIAEAEKFILNQGPNPN